MDSPRPYVTAALLCEKVLQEKDGTLSIVRIADKLQYRVEGIVGGSSTPQPVQIKPAVVLQGLIGLKSGPVSGDHTVSIVAERPSGARKELTKSTFAFLGKDQGQNMVLNLQIAIEEDGLHWFDILFDDERLTRIPLMIMPSTEHGILESRIGT
jgi:hypothetical protein